MPTNMHAGGRTHRGLGPRWGTCEQPAHPQESENPRSPAVHRGIMPPTEIRCIRVFPQKFAPPPNGRHETCVLRLCSLEVFGSRTLVGKERGKTSGGGDSCQHTNANCPGVRQKTQQKTTNSAYEDNVTKRGKTAGNDRSKSPKRVTFKRVLPLRG